MKLKRRIASWLLYPLQRLGALTSTSNKPIAILAGGPGSVERAKFMERFQFFSGIPSRELEFTDAPTWRMFFSMRPMLRYDASAPRCMPLGSRFAAFEVDPERNPNDGWAWCQFSKHGLPRLAIQRDASRKFKARVEELKSLGLGKCYLFGTGVSLSAAMDKDWSDGYRVVCNTIVRDDKLWRQIDPHFIVAGDAIYHFGFTAFARAFRSDLVKRLRETNTFFVFPDIFSAVVAREFAEFEDRLIPVPQGKHHQIHVDLVETFQTPWLGNVLNLLLLPLGCTLSRNVYLWGFDGRAPDDKLFWSNSSQHSYPELIPSLQEAHPAFFRHYVPTDKPTAYVQSVHGDQLDASLHAAEKQGWSFVMMHKTWTPTLQKRHRPAN